MSEDKEITVEQEEFLKAKTELFALNGITEEMSRVWNEAYGTVGWVSFVIPGTEHAVVFVYRAVLRDEWKTLRASLAKIQDQDQAREIFCSNILLYPKEAKHPEFWNTAPAFIPETLEAIIMNASGAEPQTPPMRL